MTNKVIPLSNYAHFKKTKPLTPLKRPTRDEMAQKAISILEVASGLPDFLEKSDYYHWYATEFCFARGVEVRLIDVERKLRCSNPAMMFN